MKKDEMQWVHRNQNMFDQKALIGLLFFECETASAHTRTYYKDLLYFLTFLPANFALWIGGLQFSKLDGIQTETDCGASGSSLANLQQRVAIIGSPPPLDVTWRTQGTQNSREQQ